MWPQSKVALCLESRPSFFLTVLLFILISDPLGRLRFIAFLSSKGFRHRGGRDLVFCLIMYTFVKIVNDVLNLDVF